MDRLDVVKRVVDLVEEAGKIALKTFGHSRVVFQKSRASVATDGDLRVEKYLIDYLRREFPSYGILAEEAGGIDTQGDYLWIIDPIDGTRYYARGVPIYSISVALKENEDLIIGVIHFPSIGETYSAAMGFGVWRDNERIACTNIADPMDALVAVEIPARHDPSEEIDRALELVRKMVYGCQRVRIMGLSSFAMCQLAHGGFDAYINLGSAAKEWDLAAGKVIASEAGAKITQENGVLVVANPRLHQALIKLLGFS